MSLVWTRPKNDGMWMKKYNVQFHKIFIPSPQKVNENFKGDGGLAKENIHIITTEGQWIFQEERGRGGGEGGKSKSMELNWNFLRGGGFQFKNPLWGRYGYFLEPHDYYCMVPENIHNIILLYSWLLYSLKE